MRIAIREVRPMNLSQAIMFNELKAGGPGSGRKKVSELLEEKGFQRTRDGFGPSAIYRHPTLRTKIAVDDRYETWRVGEHEGSGAKDLEKHLTTVDAGGVGSGRKPSPYRGLNKLKSPEKEREMARKNPKQMKLPFKAGEEMVERESGPISRQIGKRITKEGTQYCVQGDKDNLGCYPSLKKAQTVASGGSFIQDDLKGSKKKIKKVKSYADYGEPMAGSMGHAHMDTNLWFTPPSLAKRGKGNHIPTDDPGEKDNKFLDVTKRNSKDTHKERMKLLKRSAPGGLPAQIPARTTLIAPHTASYQPGMFAARQGRRRRMGHPPGQFRAFGAAKI